MPGSRRSPRKRSGWKACAGEWSLSSLRKLAPHCLGADLKDGVLTLFLDSGAWTTSSTTANKLC